MSGPTGGASCEAFVEALGLKTLFSALMGKVSFPHDVLFRY
jgi:beta-catenin-like protein 1